MSWDEMTGAIFDASVKQMEKIKSGQACRGKSFAKKAAGFLENTSECEHCFIFLADNGGA